jgi:hypothetical protein
MVCDVPRGSLFSAIAAAAAVSTTAAVRDRMPFLEESVGVVMRLSIYIADAIMIAHQQQQCERRDETIFRSQQQVSDVALRHSLLLALPTPFFVFLGIEEGLWLSRPGGGHPCQKRKANNQPQSSRGPAAAAALPCPPERHPFGRERQREGELGGLNGRGSGILCPTPERE